MDSYTIKQQGDLHESAALETIGGDAINLNKVSANFPTYDILSSQEITSVKSHMGSDAKQNVNSYLNDFNKMLGYGGRAYERGLSPVQQDAERIAALRDQGYPVPADLKGASNEEIANYLENKSIIRIPDDQVESVREALEEKHKNSPDVTEEQIKTIRSRIQGTGLTTEQTMKKLNQQQSINSESASEGENQGEDYDYYYGHSY